MMGSGVEYPLVSVITPSFNRRDFIETCLDSVRAQDYPRIEHIVVDGGSTDGTVEMLRAREAEYGLRWVSEPDDGMYHAINKGLAMADGDILSYLNTDDAYLPWSVSCAVEALSRGRSAVFGDIVVCKRNRDHDVAYVQFYPPFSMQTYTWVQTIGQPSVFWKSDVYRTLGGFDTSYALLADCEYWLRIASRVEGPHHLREVLAVQIDHEETLREIHGAQVVEEFATLRAQYGEYSSRPRNLRLRRLRASLVWRWKNVSLALGYALKRESLGWPRFLRFVRSRGVRLNYSYALLGFLPGLLRGDMGISLLDGEQLLDAVATERSEPA